MRYIRVDAFSAKATPRSVARIELAGIAALFDLGIT